MGNYEHSQGRTRVQCESTHLTSFAVLVDVTGVRKCMQYKTDKLYETFRQTEKILFNF